MDAQVPRLALHVECVVWREILLDAFWGPIVNNIQLSVVHRLPQSYRWLSGFAGIRVEPIPLSNVDDNDNLIGLKLLSHEAEIARQVMRNLALSLQEIQVESAVVEYDGEPCLFVKRDDESATMCRLKNIGVAIAESVYAIYPS